MIIRDDRRSTGTSHMYRKTTIHGNGSEKESFSVISEKADSFRRRFFPGVSQNDWNDWRWQLLNRIRDREGIEAVVTLSEGEKKALEAVESQLPFSLTPYFAHLVEGSGTDDPVRRTVIPVLSETRVSPGERDDPLGEEKHRRASCIVHRYPDRVLFLVTGLCAAYCRYCTRSRLVGGRHDISSAKPEWEKGIDYIRGNTDIRDVLVSGGDPLMLSDRKLEWLLERLKGIPHVQIVRIGTRVPVVLPQRITADLVEMLGRYHPLWMSIHVTHPDELTGETAFALNRLADAGIPMGSQTVLLAGINDSVECMKTLMHGLLTMRVRPYYLYQCDPITGSAHFRTPVKKGLEIIRGLQGFTTGFAVPTYVIDAPGGGGKIPLFPDRIVGRDGGDLLVSNYTSEVFRYPDPEGGE
ncbi:MAG: KamA family radical SAM protein [Spirochaetales bacterium]|nr:KamA family radical SAM protein [Spirochaetales bacterium]